MSASFFFYDLETSGRSPFEARVMQFAGQRTDMDLNPIGKPYNVIIRLSDDVVPDPDAILITGITPQQTLQDGISEAAFLRLFTDEIATPDTVFAGFNTVRFDDEFMRLMHYRNFYDPYEWQWKDGRGRWDLLDVVRMTRALRPEGITWPMDDAGKPTNRLELITKLNGLDHEKAHDALNDVYATIAVASLIKSKQPKLFEYLLGMRDKKKIEELVKSDEPFVYTSGKYESQYEKTTVVMRLCPHGRKQGSLVYDLRYDPTPYLTMTSEQLIDAWAYQPEHTPDKPRLPVKTLQYNRCPAVAPLGVLDAKSQERLAIDFTTIRKHKKALESQQTFCDNLVKAVDLLDERQQRKYATPTKDVDRQIYDGFFQEGDKQASRVVRAASPDELSDLGVTFKDDRLTQLVPLYKARNYPENLTTEERASWERFRYGRLLGGGQESKLALFFKRLEQLANDPAIAETKMFLLEELQLYGQSIIPTDVDDEGSES